MNNSTLFQKYYRRLVAEGWLKSLFWGFDLGCLVLAVSSFIGWAVGFEPMVWIAVLIGAVVWAIGTVLLYFGLFRPNEQKVARRLDALGLEERAVTMMELQGEDSFIALRQREDAQNKIASVKKTDLKMHPIVSERSSSRKRALALTAAIVLPLLAVAMCVIFALSIFGILPSGNNIFHPQINNYINVHYLVDDGGVIQGETEQTVLVGGETEKVVAVADYGYAFIGWSDGNPNPTRSDKEVDRELFVFAMFAELDFGDGDGGENDDSSHELFPDPDENNGTVSDDDSNNDHPFPNDQENDQNKDFISNDEVIDGETDYPDVYAQYYEMIMDAIASGQLTLTDELRAFLEAYYNSLL